MRSVGIHFSNSNLKLIPVVDLLAGSKPGSVTLLLESVVQPEDA